MAIRSHCSTWNVCMKSSDGLMTDPASCGLAAGEAPIWDLSGARSGARSGNRSDLFHVEHVSRSRPVCWILAWVRMPSRFTGLSERMSSWLEIRRSPQVVGLGEVWVP
jgi:hypothetical protein